MPIPPTDLTQRPPRSPRVRLGGYVILPRMLDKGRAQLAGTVGDYHYNCSLDQQFTAFTGVDAAELLKQLALGKSDGEILEWINANAKIQRAPSEVAAWSAYQSRRGPGDVKTHQFFLQTQVAAAPARTDIATWFSLLDVDDYASYGGKP